MRRLEGFRLMGRQYHWERFWVIEFPTLDGAEAWIEAEIAPPYGLYGYYDYELARFGPEVFIQPAVEMEHILSDRAREEVRVVERNYHRGDVLELVID